MFDTTFYALVALAMIGVVIAMSIFIPPKTGKVTDRLLPRMISQIIFIVMVVVWAWQEPPGNLQVLAAAGMSVALISDSERLGMRLVEYLRQRNDTE